MLQCSSYGNPHSLLAGQTQRGHRTHRRHQQCKRAGSAYPGNITCHLSIPEQLACKLGAMFLAPPAPPRGPTAPGALGTTWLDHPQAAQSQPPSTVPTAGGTAALEVIEYMASQRLPSLASSCSRLLSSIPSQTMQQPLAGMTSTQPRDGIQPAGQAQRPIHDERQHGRGVLLPESPAPSALPTPVHKWAQWADDLHEWYSHWTALSSSVESLLHLLPAGLPEAHAGANRLLVQLGLLEQQLSHSSAVRHALDRSIATMLAGLSSNVSSVRSGAGSSSGGSSRGGSSSGSSGGGSSRSSGGCSSGSSPGCVGDGQQGYACGKAQNGAEELGDGGRGWAGGCKGAQQQAEGEQRQPELRQGLRGGQQQQQQQRQAQTLGALARQAQLEGALQRARAVQLCMQQGSYQLGDQHAFSVVLSADQKQQMLEDYREQERALLARAVSLLHSPGAAPEVEVTAQELHEDAVMAQVAQGVSAEHGGILQLTLNTCALLLRHHPDNLIRQQVYQLGVEGRCLQALQLMGQLADVRVKIARCCGHPSYDRLSHAGSLLGSSTAACRLLMQLIGTLKLPAQQQVLQHGRSAVAAATPPTGHGIEGEAVLRGSREEPAAWMQEVVLQSLAPHSLDFVPLRQERHAAQQQQQQQQLQEEEEEEEEKQQQEQQQKEGSAQRLLFQAALLGAAPPPALLPPLPSLLAGISALLQTTMGVWLELEAGPTQDDTHSPPVGTCALAAAPAEAAAAPAADAPAAPAEAAQAGPTLQLLMQRFLQHLQPRKGEPQERGPHAGHIQSQQPRRQQQQQQQQQDGSRPPWELSPQQPCAAVVVVKVHHERRGCVGALVVHPTAACGTRYLDMEGSPHSQVADPYSQQAAQRSAHQERPTVLVGLHGYQGAVGAGSWGHGDQEGSERQQAASEGRPDRWGSRREQGARTPAQQQQQQQQQQQGVVLSESALCLWELMHELGHAVYLLLSWEPVYAQGDSRVPAASGGNSPSPSPSSSPSSSSRSSPSSGSVRGVAVPAALASCPSLLPLELQELPSTLLELMAAQPQCVAAILAAAHRHQQLGATSKGDSSTLVSRARSGSGNVKSGRSNSSSRHSNSSSNSSSEAERAHLVTPAAAAPAFSQGRDCVSNDTRLHAWAESHEHNSTGADNHAWAQQQAAALAGEVRRQLYQPLQLQLQAMTALLDQLLLQSTQGMMGEREAITTWVDLCNEALPLGFNPMFTCQQAQSMYRVMELRGRYVAYPTAWVLATAAWHHHGLDKDPINPAAWRLLRSLVFEALHQASPARPPGLLQHVRHAPRQADCKLEAEVLTGQGPGGGAQSGCMVSRPEDQLHEPDIVWLQAVVGRERVLVCWGGGQEQQLGAGLQGAGSDEAPNLKLSTPVHLVVDAGTFKACIS